jgi:protein SCO1/2
VSLRGAVFLALWFLAFPASLLAHEAGDDEQLPVIGPAPNFTLTSQDGAPVALASLRGKVVAVSFLYTRCPDICPLLIQKLVEVQDALGQDFGRKIVFVLITVDPEHDTQEVLKDYAAAWEAKPAGWSFLTGGPAAVREVVRRYGVFAVKNAQGFVDHNLVTSVVDPRGMLRVQYLGMRFDAGEFRHDLLSLVENP